MYLGKRSFVRIISYALACVGVLGVMTYKNYTLATDMKRQVEQNYMRAVDDLSNSLDSIKNTLNKGTYSTSGEMMSQLSSKLWNEASTAKVALSQLPVNELNLTNTNKFLSQVGNYSQSLAKKYSNGEVLSAEDKKNVETLCKYAEQLSEELLRLQQQLQQGYITFEKVSDIAKESGTDKQTVSITDGFGKFEETFNDYPTLIYDGPFSDHIMQKQPLMLKGLPEVTQDQALQKAKSVSGDTALEAQSEEYGKMPSYIFASDKATIAITKAGGLFSYMIGYRKIGQQSISIEEAIKKAREFMQKLGVGEMTNTYYETNNGVCIINFAGVQDGVTLYTDLIKIGVALDNGEILSFDARGYITNHTTRQLGEPAISEDEARSKLSERLTAKKGKLCVIPSDGQNEIYCWEFEGQDQNGMNVLVYINAQTGKEERILLLQISENGILTV